jgi:hypothetical protein
MDFLPFGKKMSLFGLLGFIALTSLCPGSLLQQLKELLS